MLKVLPLVLVLAPFVLLVAIAPAASASHCCGPCTHEWFDILLYAYDAFKQGGATAAVKTAGYGASYCTIGPGGVGSICDFIRCH